MDLRFIEPIWHVKDSVALAPGQSSHEAFDRLDPLFHQTGTSHERTDDTLTFRKKDPAAQDKMSIFDGGVLQIEKGPAGPVLHYHLTSRALLFCFLAPLLFLGLAQVTVALGKIQKAPAEAASDAKKAAAKDAALPVHPIDKFLGAPAPEKPDKKDGDKADGKGKKRSPTPAYVFAAIFATLYVVGRVLEARLVKSLFLRRLHG